MPNLKYTVDKILSTKFGRLQPFELLEGDRSDRRKWKCRCDCGKTVDLAERSLLKKKRRNPHIEQSCGCSWPTNRTGKDHPHFRGYEGLSGHYLSMIRLMARHRKLECVVQAKELWELFEKQGKRCALSGVPLTMSVRSETKVYTETQTASLDRIDSTKGYTIDNVQWVHKKVNFMKQELTDEEFVQWCHTISAHQKKDDPAGEYTI